MVGPPPTLESQREPPRIGVPAVEPEPPVADVEPANSLLAGMIGSGLDWLFDLFLPDADMFGWRGFGLTTPTAMTQPPDAMTSVVEPGQESTAPATQTPEAVPSLTAPPPPPPPSGAEEQTVGLTGEPPPSTGSEASGRQADHSAQPRTTGPSGRSTAAGVPTSADQVRSRVDAVAQSLPHPTGPQPARSRQPLDQTAQDIAGHGRSQADALVATPRQLVRQIPGRRAPRPPDPGPIPEQMAVIRKLMGRQLDSARLIPPPPSPRGTLPDFTLPVLTSTEIAVVLRGEYAIRAFVTGTDQRSVDERQKLLDVHKLLGQNTAGAPPPAFKLPDLFAISPPTSAPVQDEPVTGVTVSPGQRELVAAIIAELRTNPARRAGEILVAVRQGHSRFPPGALEQEFTHPVDAGLLPQITQALLSETDSLASALALTPPELDAAITDRRNEVERLRDQAAQAKAAAAGQATAVAAQAETGKRQAVHTTAFAAIQAVAADQAVRRHPNSIQARVEQALAELREPIAIELGRLDEQLRQRELAIANAVRDQISAIWLAETKDELALSPQPGKQASTENRQRQAAARHWAEAAEAELTAGPTSQQARLIEAAQTQTQTFKTQLQAAATTALAALQLWGAEHARSTDTWWTELDAQLQTWATDATARVALWEGEQSQAARLALMQDLAALQRLSVLQGTEDGAAVDAYLARLDSEASTVVMAMVGSIKAGAPDLAGAMAAGIQQRVQATHRDAWEDALEAAVMALPVTADTFPDLERLLGRVQPDAQLGKRATELQDAIERIRGHDETKIFENLSGLTPLAGRLLPWVYEQKTGQSLEDALHGYGHVGGLTAEEMTLARQELLGYRVEYAVWAIHDAITGAGADMDKVNEILHKLTPDQRSRTLTRYQEKYGIALKADLESQWTVSSSEVTETMQIAKDDLIGAQATVLQRSVRTLPMTASPWLMIGTVAAGPALGGLGTAAVARHVPYIDREAAAKVFSDLQQQVRAEGQARGWTSAQIEAEITFRSQQLTAKFDKQAAGDWWMRGKGPDVSPTDAAFALASPAGADLLHGLATNDLVKIDVARIQLEDEDLIAGDAALNLVLRDQESRSISEVTHDYGWILRARMERQLRSEEPFATAEAMATRRMELEAANADKLRRMADDRTRTRMSVLGHRYWLSSGRTLADMVEDNMSGTAKEEALARVDQGGVLDNYQKIKFSIEGLGTDLPMLKSTVSSMTKKELTTANEKWKTEHDGETLIEAIEGDTSGRDEDDLVDAATYGRPETAWQLKESVLRKEERDRAGQTLLGFLLTRSETKFAASEVGHLEKAYAELRRTGTSADEQRRALLTFDLAVERAELAIDLQRKAVDSIADTLATIGAIAIGLLLAPFTEGMSLVAAAAFLSAAATVTTIAIKASVKGSAYGAGEFGTDLAVGVIDMIIAVLTAGLGKALLGRTGALATAERSALSNALAKIGIVGRAAVRAEERIAASGAKAKGVGLLVRKMGNIGVLSSLDQSKYWALRQAGRGAALLVENVVQAIPVSVAGALLDESILRQPGGARAAWNNAVAGTVHSTLMSLGLAATMHAGKAGLQGARSVLGAARGAPHPTARPIGRDVLAHAGTPKERLAEFREWRQRNPEGTMRDFNTERLARIGDELRLADAERQRIREARGELLAGLLLAKDRGQYANLPIRSVNDAEFARLTGHQPGDAHLLVDKNGNAAIVVREGAAPGAVAKLLPEVQRLVFPYAFGLTVKAALPPHLRDTPIQIDSTLPRDAIRVIHTPAAGRITGVEVRVGPGAHPLDVALHAGEITRNRRWMGRLGEARKALARFAEHLGFEPVTPQDRTRYEAAGELAKLDPIIERQLRAVAASPDPATAAEREVRLLRLLAQHERARRILTGELKAEPRGYVAQEGETPPRGGVPEGKPPVIPTATTTEPAAKPGVPTAAPAAPDLSTAVAAWSRLRDRLPVLEQAVETASAESRALDYHAKRVFAELVAYREAFGLNHPAYAHLSAIDLTTPAGIAQLRQAIRDMLKGKTPTSRIWRPAYDLHTRLEKYESTLASHPKEKARLAAKLTTAKQAYAHASGEAKVWLQQLVQFTQGAAGVSGAPVMHVSERLPGRRSGEAYLPKLLAGESPAKQLAHLMGWHAEGSMASQVADTMPHVVVEYGGKIGPHGADAISVVETAPASSTKGPGWPVLWDSKYLSSGESHAGSDTFTQEGPRANARDQAIAAVRRNPDGRLPGELVNTAVKHLIDGNYTTYTVTTSDGSTFHTCVEIEVRNHKVVSTRHVQVPFGSVK